MKACPAVALCLWLVLLEALELPEQSTLWYSAQKVLGVVDRQPDCATVVMNSVPCMFKSIFFK